MEKTNNTHTYCKYFVNDIKDKIYLYIDVLYVNTVQRYMNDIMSCMSMEL